jgi:hypothetical protein
MLLQFVAGYRNINKTINEPNRKVRWSHEEANPVLGAVGGVVGSGGGQHVVALRLHTHCDELPQVAEPDNPHPQRWKRGLMALVLARGSLLAILLLMLRRLLGGEMGLGGSSEDGKNRGRWPLGGEVGLGGSSEDGKNGGCQLVHDDDRENKRWCSCREKRGRRQHLPSGWQKGGGDGEKTIERCRDAELSSHGNLVRGSASHIGLG